MGRFLGITVWKGRPRVGACTGTLKNPTIGLWRWEPDRRANLLLQSACTSIYRHIYDWNIVDCDVKQSPIQLTCRNLWAFNTAEMSELSKLGTLQNRWRRLIRIRILQFRKLGVFKPSNVRAFVSSLMSKIWKAIAVEGSNPKLLKASESLTNR